MQPFVLCCSRYIDSKKVRKKGRKKESKKERETLSTRHVPYVPAGYEGYVPAGYMVRRHRGRVLINVGIGRMSALRANRTRRDGRNEVKDPDRICCCGAASRYVLWRLATDLG